MAMSRPPSLPRNSYKGVSLVFWGGAGFQGIGVARSTQSYLFFFLPVCVVCEMCASVNTCVQVHTTMCGMMRPEEDTGVLSKTLPYSLGSQPLTEPEARCFWLD